MNPKIRNLLAALTVLLLSAGVALAIVQPGDLGDDETAGRSTTTSTTDNGSVTTGTPTGGSPTTETPTTETPTTETPTTETTEVPPTTPTTDGSALPASTSTTDAPPTTIAGGGLGSSGGADAVGADIANTGGDSAFFLVGATLLALLGLLARRASRPTN